MNTETQIAGMVAIVIIVLIAFAMIAGFDRRHSQIECVLDAPSTEIALLCRTY